MLTISKINRTVSYNEYYLHETSLSASSQRQNIFVSLFLCWRLTLLMGLDMLFYPKLNCHLVNGAIILKPVCQIFKRNMLTTRYLGNEQGYKQGKHQR